MMKNRTEDATIVYKKKSTEENFKKTKKNSKKCEINFFLIFFEKNGNSYQGAHGGQRSHWGCHTNSSEFINS